MKKLYIVTHHCDSAGHRGTTVHSLWSDREKAQEVSDSLRHTDEWGETVYGMVDWVVLDKMPED